jgi:hydrogenase expression/formation protein HypC
MCIGIPMRVIEAGAGLALVEGRGGVERIDTRLVGAVTRDDWLLVFQGAARERLDAARAAEINATLELLEAAMAGDAVAAAADPGFVLPSSLSPEAFAQPGVPTGGDTP